MVKDQYYYIKLNYNVIFKQHQYINIKQLVLLKLHFRVSTHALFY